ncbi:MAG: OmpA family protein [Amphritea sp.]|nr:OmpA family protein [Amphritea sp.]
MNVQNKKIFTGLLGLLSASALLIGSVQAENRGAVPGYVTNSSGEIWRNSSGECWHGSDWTEADATVVGCDGVVLDAPIEVIIGQGTGVFADITIPAASMFAFDKSELNDDGKGAVDEYITTLGPELTDAYLVLIVGHTDTSGDETYNEALSLKRAESVSDYLVSKGVEADALRVIGRGSKEPLVSNETREGRIQNRRVDILAVAEVRALDTMLFPSVALFERRSGDLSKQGKILLEKNRVEARQMLSRASFIEIVGHTDDVGDDNYNMALSKQRAASVRDYLVSKGLDASKIVTTGMGETMPTASNSTPEGRAENRRVEILLLGRIKE